MDQNSVSTWVLVIIAMSGGLGALVAGLTAAYVNSRLAVRAERQEHERWRREQVWECTTELLDGLASVLEFYDDPFPGQPMPVRDDQTAAVDKVTRMTHRLEALLPQSDILENSRSVIAEFYLSVARVTEAEPAERKAVHRSAERELRAVAMVLGVLVDKPKNVARTR